jgi:flagellar biosynthesis/type III secretory pathway protein FliH
MYERKTGKDRKHWRGLMSAETWYTAETAKEAGLVDVVYTSEKRPRGTAFRAAFNFAEFDKIPDPVKEMWGLTPAAPAAVSNNNEPPEDSTRVEPATAQQQETPKMETSTTQAAPAQAPAPATDGTTQVATPQLSATDAHRAEMERIKGMTAEATYENGRTTGYDQGLAEGDRRTMARFEQTIAACPGDANMAVKAFLAKQSPDAVKLAFEAASAVRAQAEEREREMALKNARLEQLVACGGHPGVSLGFVTDSTADTGPLDTPRATAQAEREWDTQPAVRRTAKTKEIYVAARAAELDGTHRSFAR